MLETIIIGLFIGVVAKFLMPGRDPGGFIITTLLGIAGASVGAWLGRQFGWYAVGQPASFAAAVLGAMVILLIYRITFGKKST